MGGWEIADFTNSCFDCGSETLSLESESMLTCTLNHTNWPWGRESAYFLRCGLSQAEVQPHPKARLQNQMHCGVSKYMFVIIPSDQACGKLTTKLTSLKVA